MANCTTTARVKALLGDTGSANDTLLASLVSSVSKEIEAWIGYPVTQAARTELYSLGQNDRFLFLNVIPVVSVAEVKVASIGSWDWTTVTALTADIDYHLGGSGQIYWNFETRAGFENARVTYTAGLGVDDAGVIAAAPDLALAADLQVAEDWRRRFEPSQISIPTPKGAKTMASPVRFMPRALELLARYRRVAF